MNEVVFSAAVRKAASIEFDMIDNGHCRREQERKVATLSRIIPA